MEAYPENIPVQQSEQQTPQTNNKRWLLLIIPILLIIPLFVFIISLFDTHSSTNQGNIGQKISIDNYHVLKTFPQDKQVGVQGEFELSAQFDHEMASELFTFDISPTLQHGLKYTTVYPSQILKANIIGGLDPSTSYTVSLKSKSNGRTLYTWSFTAADKPPESAPILQQQIENNTIKDYYPLFNYVPYNTDNFSIDYTGHLNLEVRIKNSDTNAVKQEVTDWIKSKGVDPSTHTITYINNF